MTITINDIAFLPGCYIDGHWGQYGASRVLRIADDILGTAFFEHAADHSETEVGIHTDELESSEVVVWASEQAEQSLNDVTRGGFWEWHDGEFFLVDNDAEEDDDA